MRQMQGISCSTETPITTILKSCVFLSYSQTPKCPCTDLWPKELTLQLSFRNIFEFWQRVERKNIILHEKPGKGIQPKLNCFFFFFHSQTFLCIFIFPLNFLSNAAFQVDCLITNKGKESLGYFVKKNFKK